MVIKKEEEVEHILIKQEEELEQCIVIIMHKYQEDKDTIKLAVIIKVVVVITEELN